MIHMFLQLHITGKCNLRCKHCYIDEHSTEMPLEDIIKVLNQFDELVKGIIDRENEKVVKHLHMTGGEPLYHSRIKEILSLLNLRKKDYRIGIMSNGTMLNKEILEKLAELNLEAFQVSLDGERRTHDKIRGEGNFDEVLRALDLLSEYGIPTRVSFTANQENYSQFPAVAKYCRKHQVNSLWSDRYIPFIDGELKALTEADTREYVKVLQEEHENIENAVAQLRVENYRALQFLSSGAQPYICKAGEALVTVDEYGNIFPCRRLPLNCGNIQQITLAAVYFEHPVFKELRKHHCVGKCEDCIHKESCLGGARCMTYAIKGDFHAPDPGCYL